ncbi:hypothetical protein AVEN_184687-1 [Araneus ventricosus]|uniref:Uncharacterized protein n=1 Tax=Araneus ventricosus TaxID=182803 RepID=A0A4Y2RT96_ARAVE|nr:hypothetical protein AVEN_184687-1 [Araneus ventricosus]
MRVLWLEREFYRGKCEMTSSSHVWSPDFGDHLSDKFGDEIWDLKGAGIFSISLLDRGDTYQEDSALSPASPETGIRRALWTTASRRLTWDRPWSRERLESSIRAAS